MSQRIRLSAYDVVLPDPVPGKGEVLTAISNFWFGMMADIVPHHLSKLALEDVITDQALCEKLRSRTSVARRLQPLPVEAVVRGYLIGSGWRDYLETGGVCGIALPARLEQAEALPETLFTPATKAASGDHDENISFADHVRSGWRMNCRPGSATFPLLFTQRAAAYAIDKGIIIADTKFEFGQSDDGEVFIIDEILTPDSSRFWPAADYEKGMSPPSFDKQFVRDYLDTLDWDKTAPGPRLPARHSRENRRGSTARR